MNYCMCVAKILVTKVHFACYIAAEKLLESVDVLKELVISAERQQNIKKHAHENSSWNDYRQFT